MMCKSCRNEITNDQFFCPRCSEFTPRRGCGKKAGLFSRYVALLIDPLIAVLAWFTASLVGGAIGGEGLALSMAVFFPIAYFIWFLSLLPKGLTPGKKLLGLQVVDYQTGATPGFGKMFLREIPGRILSGAFLSLGYFWAIWDKNAQAWHDKLAGTVVVKTLGATSISTR